MELKIIHPCVENAIVYNRLKIYNKSNNPKDKADWIEDKIDNDGYDDVYFADDSLKNVNITKKMLRRKDVKWRVQHIKH